MTSFKKNRFTPAAIGVPLGKSGELGIGVHFYFDGPAVESLIGEMDQVGTREDLEKIATEINPLFFTKEELVRLGSALSRNRRDRFGISPHCTGLEP